MPRPVPPAARRRLADLVTNRSILSPIDLLVLVAADFGVLAITSLRSIENDNVVLSDVQTKVVVPLRGLHEAQLKARMIAAQIMTMLHGGTHPPRQERAVVGQPCRPGGCRGCGRLQSLEQQRIDGHEQPGPGPQHDGDLRSQHEPERRLDDPGGDRQRHHVVPHAPGPSSGASRAPRRSRRARQRTRPADTNTPAPRPQPRSRRRSRRRGRCPDPAWPMAGVALAASPTIATRLLDVCSSALLAAELRRDLVQAEQVPEGDHREDVEDRCAIQAEGNGQDTRAQPATTPSWRSLRTV